MGSLGWNFTFPFGMRTSLLSFALLSSPVFLPPQASAQIPFAPLGATWTYTHEVGMFPVPIISSAYTLTATGDSLVGGQLCRKVEGASLPCNETGGLFYQSNDSVFLWNPNANMFGLLYRWDAQAGDSWSMAWMIGGTPDTMTYSVLATGIITINGQSRRKLTVQLMDQLTSGASGGELIEGIGDVGYLLPWYTAICDGYFMAGLRCYEDSLVGLYMRPGITSCDIPTGIDGTNSDRPFLTGPSIVNAGEPFAVNTAPGSAIELFTSDGRCTRRLVAPNGTVLLSAYAPGVYLLRVSAPSGSRTQRLIVK